MLFDYDFIVGSIITSFVIFFVCDGIEGSIFSRRENSFSLHTKSNHIEKYTHMICCHAFINE